MVIAKKDNENPLLELYNLNQLRPIDKRDENKVRSLISDYIKKLIKIPQTLNNSETIKICNKLYSVLYESLMENVSFHNVRLLIYTLKRLELTEAYKIISSRKLEQSKYKYSRKDYQARMMSNYAWYNETSAGLKLLISIILQSRMVGSKNFKFRKWSYIFSLILEMNRLSKISDYNYYGLANYKLLIDQDFQYSIKGEEIFNLDQYSLAFGKKFHTLSKYDYREKINKQPFIEDFKIVSDAYLSVYNFHPRELIILLGNLWRMSYYSAKSTKSDFIFIDHDKLRKYPNFPIFKFSEDVLHDLLINSRFNKIKSKQIIPILSFLKLKTNDYSKYSANALIIPSNLIKNQKRISINPIIYHDKNFIFGNECCHIAALNWMNYFKTATFPLKADKNNAIDKALRRFHSIKDKKLEEEVSEIARNTVGANNVESNIYNFKRLSPKFEKRPECGEIDLLVANPEIKIMFVIEVKNLAIRILPGDNKNAMKEFYGIPLDKKSQEKSYYHHLQLKSKFIQNNFKEVLRHFSILDLSGWKIRSAFLLPEYIIPVFKNGINVNFIRKDDLITFITNDF